jgi:PIN domain nuclease of toxin-antitoxin system
VIVVDTHAVIWLTQDQGQLSGAAGSALIEARREGRLAIADITLREIAAQSVRGRLTVSPSLEVYLRFIESQFMVLPINGEIAERSARFGSLYPKDPADRLIGATALIHGARLVTKDVLIRASGEVECIW